MNWFDGPYVIEKPSSAPVFSEFIPTDNTRYVLTQKFQQLLSAKKAAPTAMGTAHAVYSDFLLVAEDKLEDIGGGVVEWERTYMKLPPSWDAWETFAYTFIGFTQLINSIYVTRDPQNLLIDSRVQNDYFFVPSTGVTDPILGGAPFNIGVPGDIPIVIGMVYCSQGTITGTEILGGVTLAVKYLNVQGGPIPTYPTADQYLSMISDALTNKWGASKSKIILYPDNTLSGTPPSSGHQAGAVNRASSIPDATTTVQGGQIPVENSRLSQVKGGLYVRRTRYVLAE